MSRVTVYILSLFISCACRGLCSLPASYYQNFHPLQGTQLVVFMTPAHTRVILLLLNSLFLKLQSCAPGHRFFSRHHWSVSSSLVPTLSSTLLYLVFSSLSPLGTWSPATFYPARWPLFTRFSNRLGWSSHKGLLRWKTRDECHCGRERGNPRDPPMPLASLCVCRNVST